MVPILPFLYSLPSWFFPTPRPRLLPSSPSVSSSPSTPQKEVFHIGPNAFTYEEAKEVCSSYGASLATYENIEQSYQQGKEWCQYGWSENQNAYFPTQKKTYMELQKDPNTANTCGRTGVNGGFFSNPFFKLGINCYGPVPSSSKDISKLKPSPSVSISPSQNNDVLNSITPSSTSNSTNTNTNTNDNMNIEDATKQKVDFWKNNSNAFLQVYA